MCSATSIDTVHTTDLSMPATGLDFQVRTYEHPDLGQMLLHVCTEANKSYMSSTNYRTKVAY